MAGGHMRFPVISIWAGLSLAAAALWQTHPLLALVPAALLVGYGLILDDDPDGG